MCVSTRIGALAAFGGAHLDVADGTGIPGQAEAADLLFDLTRRLSRRQILGTLSDPPGNVAEG